MSLADADADLAERHLLIIDDDEPFRTRLIRAMEKRHFRVTGAQSVAEGVAANWNVTSSQFTCPSESMRATGSWPK